jgi:hypothetical protein
MSDEQQPGGRFCPNCGTQAGAAKFCPECGTDLSVVRRALQGGQASEADSPARTVRTTGGRRRAGTDSGSAQPSAPRPPAAGFRAGGLSPWILIGGAAVAVAIILVVVFLGVRSGSSSSSTSGSPGSSATPSATPVVANTSGTYAQLVKRANDLYDQGSAAFGSSQFAQSAAYFGAAATIYQAAWNKKSGDPNVGTDWATSVFYSGDISSAMSIVEMVLAKNPTFQPALLNKGNFLAHQAQLADPSGKSSAAKKFNAQAKAVYQQAASVDPTSKWGKQAAAAAAAL